ncbi:ATP-grasp domain-containing protein [Rubripirellula sp.]|nr:ATP-grasp domain-containing protein [Rubripirellula sp.]
MMKQKLAIIGASYLQLPLVLKARELNVDTLCFAWENGAVARDHCDAFYPMSILDKDAILEVCVRENIDGITSIASDVAVPTMSYIAEQLHLVGNSVCSAELCTNKHLMRNALLAAGLKSPKYVAVSSIDTPHVCATHLTYPLIIKPVDRSGSLGVTKITQPSELPTAVENALKVSLAGEAIIEEFVNGTEVSVETVSWAGAHHHLCITDKETSGDPHFVELAHHQPTLLPDEICTKIRTDTALGLEALRVTNGASHAEFIVAGKEVFVTEIGARMGGDFIGSDLVQLSTNFDFLKAVIEISLGHFQTPAIEPRKYSGVYFYSAETPGVLNLINNVALYPEIVRAELTSNEKKPLESSSDRSGYAIYQSDRRLQHETR